MFSLIKNNSWFYLVYTFAVLISSYFILTTHQLQLHQQINQIVGNEIIATDLKVTWTNDDFFTEYFLKRRADIQAYVYRKAVEFAYPEYICDSFRFVVADSTNFNVPLIYWTDDSWMDKTYNGFTYDGKSYKGLGEIIDEIKWHQSRGDWTVSKKAFDNQGVIKL